MKTREEKQISQKIQQLKKEMKEELKQVTLLSEQKRIRQYYYSKIRELQKTDSKKIYNPVTKNYYKVVKLNNNNNEKIKGLWKENDN